MNITVVGLGVIGGSFVKALKGKGHHVYGVDINEQTLQDAKKQGYIEAGYKDANDVLKKTDLTIICLYPSDILDFIQNHTFKSGSMITDVVGIKSYYLDTVFSLIQSDVEYIGGHPMAGREKRGFAYADAKVFKDANYIIIHHPKNDVTKIQFMESFVQGLGFKSVKIISPSQHDKIISYTSQLPHVLAVALINSDKKEFDTGKYIGDSFRDLTRIANINEDLWTELFLNNKEYLIQSIEQFETRLHILKQAILSDDKDTLKQEFKESTYRREHLEK